MKAFLMATAMVAAPLFAQTTPPAEAAPPMTTTTETTTDTMSTTAAPMQAAPDAAPMPSTDAAPMAPAPMDPAMSPTPMAPSSGGNVVFQAPMAADAMPAAKASYPFCSRTVTDGCKQRVDPK